MRTHSRARSISAGGDGVRGVVHAVGRLRHSGRRRRRAQLLGGRGGGRGLLGAVGRGRGGKLGLLGLVAAHALALGLLGLGRGLERSLGRRLLGLGVSGHAVTILYRRLEK